MKIKTGDKVRIIAGTFKGKEGAVLRVLPDLDRVIVEGMGTHKKIVRTAEGNKETEQPRSLHASNVMVLDPKDNKPTKIGVKRDGKKVVRVAKLSGKEL